MLVEQIVTYCPNLETITMAGVKGITDIIPETISLHCKSLKRVSFRNCDLTDDGVCKVAVHCSQLVMIALAGIHDLTDKSIVALAENCPDLREVYISGCAKITKQAVTYLKVGLYVLEVCGYKRPALLFFEIASLYQCCLSWLSYTDVVLLL